MTERCARSISRSVLAGPLLERGPAWRVLAAFERACDLANSAGDVVALVLPGIGDGPLNVVVEGQPGAFAAVEPGTTVRAEKTALSLGDLRIRLDRAALWEPCPDWARLRRNRAQSERRLPLVRDLARQKAPPDRLLVGRIGNLPNEEAMAAELAGLGRGLTPAGDDFLMGLILRTWLTHPEPERFCQELAEIAAPRTTTLSAALLRAAARGECNAAWHHLLDALLEETDGMLARAVEGILAYGHTSGADTLAGFLWIPTSRSLIR